MVTLPVTSGPLDRRIDENISALEECAGMFVNDGSWGQRFAVEQLAGLRVALSVLRQLRTGG